MVHWAISILRHQTVYQKKNKSESRKHERMKARKRIRQRLLLLHLQAAELKKELHEGPINLYFMCIKQKNLLSCFPTFVFS